MKKTLVTLLGLALLSKPAIAEKVYKYEDENGNVVFTDEPVKGAETLDIKPVPTVPALKVPTPVDQEPQDKPFSYQAIKITQPEHEENFINNQGQVTVTVSLTPKLRPSDQIQLYFNGEAQGKPQSATVFPFQNLDRGSYSVEAEVLDKTGKSLGKSSPVSFVIRRASVRPTSP